MWFLYILLMLLILVVLIFIHELGHFITARICGVAVKEFAIGMGPTLFSWKSKRYDTKYGIRAIPIGGFVSMVGEDEDSDDDAAFCKKSVPKRMLIVIAGATMNLILGFLLMMVIVTASKNLGSTQIYGFQENALSSEKLMAGDKIVKVGGTSVHTSSELVYEIMNQGYEPIDITVIRNGEKQKIEKVSFGTFTESGAVFGNADFIVHAEAKNVGTVLKHTFFRSVSTVKMVFDSLIGMFSGRFGLEAVSGPVGVAQVVGQAAQLGWQSVIYLSAVLSINLGVMNMIPFPALDGGRFILLGIEGIRRKPINKNVESYINFVGIIILFAFMIFITCKDILQLIFK